MFIESIAVRALEIAGGPAVQDLVVDHNLALFASMDACTCGDAEERLTAAVSYQRIET